MGLGRGNGRGFGGVQGMRTGRGGWGPGVGGREGKETRSKNSLTEGPGEPWNEEEWGGRVVWNCGI